MAALALLSACSGGEHAKDGGSGPAAGEKPPEPVTLTIHASGLSEQEFNTRFKDALQQKYPHLTITWLQTSGAGNTIQDYIARGEIPDIIRSISSTIHQNYLDLGLAYDLRELVKAHQYDLSRFNPIFIDGFINLTAQNGELYGLPVSPFFSRVLYYNKDLFDQFGRPYPKNGMTWDETYEAARSLSRMVDGVHYRGFSAFVSTFFTYNEYSLPTLDPSKDQLASFDTWKKLFDNYVRFYQLPNNPIGSTPAQEQSQFKNGTVAMHADIFSPYLDLSMLKNWDMAAIPVMADGPKKIGVFPPGYLLITKQSKHKDEAFRVIMEMLTDDVQMKDARNGFLPTVANSDMMRVLGQDNESLKNKNMEAVGYYEFAALRPARDKGQTFIDTRAADKMIENAFMSAAQGKEDVNTVLRKADELLRQEVEKEKSKTK